ncbi:MAG: hypothetical protein A2487_13480 [Candidatus Raymondbacteria bacterium RifOxyC12_full_50_8]|uniref:Uncharacterized protein n=1 Tax=Candidatus Raymondbacteria bacterium RIFOXYD12_FULL_49_13 TaxID=1817890 RepID=A0A1F7F7R6_UNCRA|nr:MAG: hypothetical protein A2248_13590 [Candidatus Raymondbacteria bacterium RIFOXYA2_FULL_49_16]OGJ95158.1 MAG: hypothetical protein A2350_09445 [Candidatus Raymondbacteria bacterium RifOxyB12_full_50_8]OGK00370.1 MAG: hypothetical protein A2487_13480 [Candidatus Raymondbacteria bacterium RifOxyC12_full_50_8]OGK02714.1 MAG: hypothetical protein A2519_09635 [Candidatus Raymondbacteria bacterium RIFOXYD12_FULL_49_13]OGP42360.1 MAG: hypothetical protein A2324_20305 [Candidatus Raymondbacteria b
MSSYTSNLLHFLDKDGNIPQDIHPEGKKMASFLTSVVDKVSASFPFIKTSIETGLKCGKKNCQEDIIGALDNINQPIHWYCMKCGDNGTISDWKGSQWDHSKKIAEDNPSKKQAG